MFNYLKFLYQYVKNMYLYYIYYNIKDIFSYKSNVDLFDNNNCHCCCGTPILDFKQEECIQRNHCNSTKKKATKKKKSVSVLQTNPKPIDIKTKKKTVSEIKAKELPVKTKKNTKKVSKSKNLVSE